MTLSFYLGLAAGIVFTLVYILLAPEVAVRCLVLWFLRIVAVVLLPFALLGAAANDKADQMDPNSGCPA